MLCPFIQTGPPTAADKELRAASALTEHQATDVRQENHKHTQPAPQPETQ